MPVSIRCGYGVTSYCSFQGLDEVQSYILVERSIEHVIVPLDSVVKEFPHLVSGLVVFSFILSSCCSAFSWGVTSIGC